jgi:hypothetical protein
VGSGSAAWAGHHGVPDDDESRARERCLAVGDEQWKSDRRRETGGSRSVQWLTSSYERRTGIARVGGAKDSQRAKPQRS